MSLILRKIGPCTCEGICSGICSYNPYLSLRTVSDLPLILRKVYCINLPDSKERRKAMQNLFKKIKESSSGYNLLFEFIRAISPADHEYIKLLKKEKVDMGSHPRCYCLHENSDHCEKHNGRALRKVEIAISISHHHVYQQMIRNHDKIALVCEDDVLLLPNLMEILSKALGPKIDELLSDVPVIFFGGGRNNPNLEISDPDKFSIKETTSGLYSNYCYILNRAAAKILDQHFYPINRPEDSYKRFLINKELIKGYQIFPAIVAELSSGINTKPIYQRLSKLNSLGALERSIHEEMREIEQLVIEIPKLEFTKDIDPIEEKKRTDDHKKMDKKSELGRSKKLADES